MTGRQVESLLVYWVSALPVVVREQIEMPTIFTRMISLALIAALLCLLLLPWPQAVGCNEPTFVLRSTEAISSHPPS